MPSGTGCWSGTSSNPGCGRRGSGSPRPRGGGGGGARERLARLEEEERTALGRGEEEAALRLVISQLEGFARRVKEGLHEADWETRREVVRALVKRVEVGEEEVRVVYKVSPPTLPGGPGGGVSPD